MFNTNNFKAGDTNLKINACSGGIYKTYKESWFQRFHLKSNLAESLFNNKNFTEVRNGGTHYEYGRGTVYDLEKKEVIVLQMVICGEMEVIAELITKENFDKYFIDKHFESEE